MADCKVPGVQVDGLSVFSIKTDYSGTSVAAVDSEGVSSPAVASGQAVPPATYVIKYDANGADGGTAPASQNKTQYTDITLATNSGGLTRIGYRFTGWNTDRNGNGTTYAEGATYSADESVTLYAKWEAVDAVDFTLGSSAVNHDDTVTLTSPKSDATIHYQINGTGETAGAKGQPVTVTLYNGNYVPQDATGAYAEIPEGDSVTITAYAVYDDGTESMKTTREYRLKQYTVSYNGNKHTGGTEPSQQIFYSGDSVAVWGNDSLTKEGYTFTGWLGADGNSYSQGNVYDGNENLTLTAQWEYQLRDSVQVLAGYSSPNHTDGTWKYVEFGYWPQTVKAADVTVDKSKSKLMGRFTYYLGSDGNWYVEAAENAYGSGTEYQYSNGDQAGQGGATTKWFKVEPIVWRVLTEDYNSTGKALLLAEKVLTGGIQRDDDKNNYMESNIRRWLNGNSGTGETSDYAGDNGFLQTAFTSAARDKIAETDVDNSVASTFGRGESIQSNPYASNTPTTDKVFLLSVQEATTSEYGFAEYNVYVGDNNGTTISTRIRVTTDYAKATGAEQSSTLGYGGWWWLRSSSNVDVGLARIIYYYGNADFNDGVYETDGGVVPALSISLGGN